nr:hypothetical protein [Microbacterium bovistercoris]
MTLKEYDVTVAGRHPHKTTMLLNEADAKRLGGVEVKTSAQKAAKPPANKARTPANKAAKPAAKKAPAAKPAAAKQDSPAKPDPASDPDASE